MTTFQEKFGAAEAQRIANDSFQKVTGSEERLSVIDCSGTLKDCGIHTPSQRDLLLHEVKTQLRERGYKIDSQYLYTLHIDSDISSLVHSILMSLPGDEDFDEPSEDVADFQRPLKRRLQRRDRER